MFGLSKSRKRSKSDRRIAELESESEALRRMVRVLEVERDALAAVIARDRERVKAETAAFAARSANGEHGGRG